MKKFSKILALFCGFILLFSALVACTPTTGTSTGGGSSESTSQTGSDSTSTGGDSTSTGGGSSTGGDSTSTGGGSSTGGSLQLPDGPLTDEEQALYNYYPQITSQMPAVRINTTDGKNTWATQYRQADKIADRIEYVDATITVNNCEDDYAMSDVEAEVKVRGNYTLEYEKKPIRIKFGKKNNMLGLHDGEKYKNWVLLADWKDLAMTNNTLAYYLGNTILGSDGYYCTDFRNVEVYLNGQYWGVYLLVEQQEVKDGRTSVPEVEDDYTGTDIGYLFEYDGYYYQENEMPNDAGDPTFEMNYSGGWYSQRGYTVKSDIYSDAQLNFIRNYMNNAYRIATEAINNRMYKFNDTYTNIVSTTGTAKEVISAVIDVQSLVDTYILNEIACDPDIAWSSFYISVNMTADGNKKVTFEAPWDFDSAFGIRSGYLNNATGMYASTTGNPWLELLVRQDWFQEMVREKWNKLCRAGVPQKALELIQDQKTTYQKYYENNHKKWINRVNDGNGEVVGELNALKDPATAQGLAADYVYNWLQTRFNYLNTQWVVVEVDENIPQGATAYKFEAESATFGGGLDNSAIRSGADRSYASGNAYVGNLSGGAGRTLTFTVTAEKATTVYLFAGISKRATQGLFNNWFSVTANGTAVPVPVRYIDAIANGEAEWHTFVSVKVAPVELKAGKNTIVFSTGGDSTNFDYIELYSTTKLS